MLDHAAQTPTQNERQVCGDKREANVKSCGPEHPEGETSMGNKWETKACGPDWETSVGRQVKACGPERPEWDGDKWKTSVKLCGPEHPERATSGEVGDTCKIMRPRAPTVGNKCGKTSGRHMKKHAAQSTHSGKQVWEDKRETSVKSCGPGRPEWETDAEDKWETSVKSCDPDHPKQKSMGDKRATKSKSLRPRPPRLSGRQVWETSGRQA